MFCHGDPRGDEMPVRETVDILPVGPVKYNDQGSPSIRSFGVGFEKHLSNVKLVGSLSRVAPRLVDF